MRNQDTVRENGCCSAPGQQGTRGADLHRITRTVKGRHRVIIGILSSDLDIKGSPRRLGPNGSSTLRFDHEMIQGSRIHSEGIRHSGLATRAQTANTISRRDGKASHIAHGHAMGCQYTVGKRERRTTARGQRTRRGDFHPVASAVKCRHRVVIGVFLP